MIRYGVGILVAAGACAAVGIGVSACGDSTPAPNNGGSGGGGASGASGNSGATATGGGGGAAGAPTTGCTDACCPTKAVCYSDATLGQSSPGAECLATQKNDPNGRIQMRQQWLHPVAPAGNTSAIVYGALNAFTTMPWPDCNMGGTGGSLELVDFDIANGTSRVGYALNVGTQTVPTALASGLCMVDDIWTAAQNTHYLPKPAKILPGSDKWPKGLPAPMWGGETPWHFGPTKATRLDHDFDITQPPNDGSDAGKGAPTQREELLARLDPTTGDLGKQGFTGVFYYDSTKGESHGYGTIGWLTIYESATGYIVVPIREAEIRSKFNDPTTPDCVGKLNTANLSPTSATPCAADNSTPTKAAWECDGACPQLPASAKVTQTPDGPGSTVGYFLIPELEQVYSSVLKQTLCVSYYGTDPTSTAMPPASLAVKDGFSNPITVAGGAAFNCETAKWDPTADGDAGLPHGDWCAATNAPATATCHDAWRSISFHVFAGSKIADATCKAL